MCKKCSNLSSQKYKTKYLNTILLGQIKERQLHIAAWSFFLTEWSTLHMYIKTRPFHANVSCLTTEKKNLLEICLYSSNNEKQTSFTKLLLLKMVQRWADTSIRLQTDSPSMRLINPIYFCSQLGTNLISVLFPEDYQVRYYFTRSDESSKIHI